MADYREDFAKYIPDVPDGTRYWLVRTQAGALYHSFIRQSMIAVGYPELTVEYLRSLSATSDFARIEALREWIKTEDPENERPGLGARQVNDFCYVMKRGDFVIIPSAGSERFSVGRIVDDKVSQEQVMIVTGDEPPTPYTGFFKIRKVQWMGVSGGRSIDANVYLMFNNHQAVTSVDDYAEFINPLVFSMFTRNGKLHLVLRIRRTSDISAGSLFRTLADILELSDHIAEDVKVDERSSSVNARAYVRSPGIIEFIGPGLEILFIIGAITVAAAGGKFELNIPGHAKMHVSTRGLIKAITDAIDAKSNRNIRNRIADGIGSLDAVPPGEILEMLTDRKQISGNEEEVEDA